MVSPKRVLPLIGLTLTAAGLSLIFLLVGRGEVPAIALDVAGLALLAILGMLVWRWQRESARVLHERIQEHRAAELDAERFRRREHERARALLERLEEHGATGLDAQRPRNRDPRIVSRQPGGPIPGRLTDPPGYPGGWVSARWVLAQICLSLTVGVLGLVLLLVGRGPAVGFEIAAWALLALLAIWVLVASELG